MKEVFSRLEDFKVLERIKPVVYVRGNWGIRVATDENSSNAYFEILLELDFC